MNGNHLKILLIDDNKDITTMMSKYLKLKGHDCMVSNDGRNGLAILEQQKFDTVLLDLAMPDFSGVDVVNNLYNSGKINGHRIILFTASSVKEDEIQDLIKKGVHSCLKKPVTLDVLIKSIGG